ncbi:MAG: apolipoprotein N-acyltransferase [Candidatus Sungbacteria bacterium]|nr:apolipoprotein N-acyltransferase [Candidatus Sungbacteria bacterium]
MAKKYGFLIFSSSLLVGAAFWIQSLWFLMLFALLPFIYALDQMGKKMALGASAFFVVITGLVMAYPLLRFRTVQSIMPAGDELFFLLLVTFFYVLTLAVIAFFLLWLGIALLKKPMVRITFLPLAWIGFEFLRTKLSFGLAWLSVGEPLVEFLPLGVYARIGGIYVLSFFIALFNVALYESIKYLILHKEKTWRWTPLFTTFLLFILLSAGGMIYAGANNSTVKTGRTFSVAIIQAGSLFNYHPEEKDYYRRLHMKTKEATAKEKIPDADLIVLPANYMKPAAEAEILENKIREELDFLPKNSPVLFGVAIKRDGQQYETSVLSLPGGEIQTTSKEYLFPFVEYFPLYSEKFLPKLKKFTTQYTHGDNQVLFLKNGIAFGVLFCSEEFVPQVSRKAKRNGANLLVISGNTDDFASGLAFKEVLRAGRLRALENNIYVIHALKSGISAVIDPDGRVLKQLGKDEAGVLYTSITF